MKRGRTQKLSDTQRQFSEFRAAPFAALVPRILNAQFVPDRNRIATGAPGLMI